MDIVDLDRSFLHDMGRSDNRITLFTNREFDL